MEISGFVSTFLIGFTEDGVAYTDCACKRLMLRRPSTIIAVVMFSENKYISAVLCERECVVVRVNGPRESFVSALFE